MQQHDEAVLSPICNVDEWILSSAITVAPRKAQELFRLLKESNVHFKYVEDAGFVFEAGSTRDEEIIRASIPTLELLWSAAYGYWEMYQLVAAVERRGDRTWTPSESNRRALIEGLFTWALTNGAQRAAEEWPEALPAPTLSFTAESPVQVATELFLVAVGWILHHEVSQIVFSHSEERSPARMDEWEADQRATGWLFEGVEDGLIREKLGLGVVVALGMLAARREPGKYPEGPEDHPHPLERLPHALAAIGASDNDAVYAFAISALQMNLILTEYTYVPLSDASFRTQLEDFCLLLRSHHSRHWMAIPTSLLSLYWATPLASSSHDETALLAYDFWQHRGQPMGSPEVDWYRAEQVLNEFLSGRRAKLGGV